MLCADLVTSAKIKVTERDIKRKKSMAPISIAYMKNWLKCLRTMSNERPNGHFAMHDRPAGQTNTTDCTGLHAAHTHQHLDRKK